MIESDISTLVLATAAITNLTSTRVYVGQGPQTVTYPFITINRVSLVSDAQAGIDRARVQFTIYADTAVTGDAIASTVRTLFYRRVALLGSKIVQSISDAGQYFYESSTKKHIFTEDIFFQNVK